MQTASIVRQATAKARRAVLIALAGVIAITAAFFVERLAFQHDLAAASARPDAARSAAHGILLARDRLTMVANMAAATGEEHWSASYEQALQQMDGAISEAMALAPPDAPQSFDAEARVANESLVALERLAFDAVRSGNLAAARTILSGEAYAGYRTILVTGAARFAEGMTAAAAEDLRVVEGRAVWVFAILLLVLSAGGFVLWRGVSGSLARFEGAFLATEQKIETMAMSDMLTGLANRASFRHALSGAIARADASGSRLALLMIDLDRFKPINDRHGHLVGDLVLKEVARRMRALTAASDLRARYGGDEFLVAIGYPGGDDIPHAVADRLVDGLSEPMIFDGLTLEVGASIGIAIYPDDAATEEDAIQKADMALHRAKLEGRGTVRAYDAELDVAMEARARMADELAIGIARDEVVPYFQPLVDLATGAPRGFEILSRWQHPGRGIVAPAEFIGLAESAGLIGNLTISVLRQACIVARSLPERLTLSLNLSPAQLQDGWLSSQIHAVLAETGFDPHRLEVELTEDALITDLAVARQVIAALKSQGIRIALDDFGTGYSSLSYLSELQFDCIKIDRTFVRTIAGRPESAKVVSAIVGLGKSLNLSIVAEGVESERDAEVLRAIGCPLAQGFHYSEAVPANALAATIALLERQHATRAVA